MRLRVLIFVAHYLPGYKSGGPVRTITNLVEHLGDQIDFKVVTNDRDLMDTEPYPGIEAETWSAIGKGQVFYCPPRQHSVRYFGRLMRETPHEVLYLNSFFNPTFTLQPLLARRLGIAPWRPCILAPRGEFSEGALGLKKWKKRLFIALIRKLNVYKDVIWQASSEHEAKDIRHVLGEMGPIEVAPDLPPVVVGASGSMDVYHRNSESSLKVVFLSRITPKKNLTFALRMMARVTVPVEFNIYGPVQDEDYWRQCREIVERMPPHITVTYQGPVDPTRVPGILGAHDVFLFPTLGENYGHVIPEALSVGTPVLISDTTPWRGLAEDGVGWDLPLESQAEFVRCLEHCASMTSGAYEKWRETVRDYAERSLGDPDLVEANRELFFKAFERSLSEKGGRLEYY